MSFENVRFTLPNFLTSTASTGFYRGQVPCANFLGGGGGWCGRGGKYFLLNLNCSVINAPLFCPLLQFLDLAFARSLRYAAIYLSIQLQVAPLFTVLSASVLASMQFAGFLSLVVSPLNLDPSRFSLHSFRKGGVTFVFDCHISHIPSEHIKLQKDWQSDACLVHSELSQQQSLSLCFWSNWYQLYEHLSLRITIFWSPLSINPLFFLLQFGHFNVLGLLFSNRFSTAALSSKLILPKLVCRLSNVGNLNRQHCEINDVRGQRCTVTRKC